MLKMRFIDEESKEYVRKLYEDAFPDNERRAIEELWDPSAKGYDFVVFYDNDLFCGFASLLTWKDITHILYFSIQENMRKCGYGSKALDLMQSLHPQNRFIADIEMLSPSAENTIERAKRKKFYLNNGYHESGVQYVWRGENYEILIKPGEITDQEFWNFWSHFSSRYPQTSEDNDENL